MNNSETASRSEVDRPKSVLTNSFIDRNFKTAIFKSDISGHFPICFITPSTKPKIGNKTSFILKSIFNFDFSNKYLLKRFA